MNILSLMRDRAKAETCPRCRRTLRDCELAMLRDDDPQYTLQVTCTLCRVTFVVVVQVRDRSAAEAAEGAAASSAAPAAPPISAAEMLDLHELLRDHRGPLTELLSSR